MADCGEFTKMKHRISLQAVSQVSDSQGGFTESWATFATVWASIRPAKGFEKFQAAQLQTPVTHKITIRYRPDVTTKHRLLFGTRVFGIKEALNRDEAKQYLDIQAIEQQ